MELAPGGCNILPCSFLCFALVLGLQGTQSLSVMGQKRNAIRIMPVQTCVSVTNRNLLPLNPTGGYYVILGARGGVCLCTYAPAHL
jgi:hypothetical protein